jgi:hypothetical protein
MLDRKATEIIVPIKKRFIEINKKDYMSSGGDSHLDYTVTE